MNTKLTDKSTPIDQRLEMLENMCSYKITQTRENVESRKKHEKAVDDAIANQMIASTTMDNLKKQIKRVATYNAKKKEKSMASIYSAIYAAKTIIPDTQEAHLNVQAGEAWFANERGQMVNLREGSAFRAILSFLSRGTILDNTPYEPFMLLDEPLSTVSVENSAQFSAYLPALANNKAIILIEQKNEAFSAIDCPTYIFEKSEGYTRVRRLRGNEAS